MFLLVIVLPEEKQISKLLTKFIDIDVRGATIINSYGMGELLSRDVPVFSSLRSLLSGENSQINNHTVFSVIRTEETLQKAIETVKNFIDFSKPNSGIMFTLPLLNMYGLAEPLQSRAQNDR
jgi:hypothetical protein